jgi:aminoglycoside 3-N-acetyltransferase
MITRAKLLEQLRGLGVAEGMDLLVHSSLRRIGPVEGKADGVIDALLEAIGPDGTLILPTHTWQQISTGQPVFHVERTPSCVGALTEVFRQRPGAIRSLHPTHSVAAIGPRAAHYTEGQLDATTPCPADSAYGRICRTGRGHILLLGVTLMHNTTLHALEEEVGLPGLLYDRPRRLTVIDAEGNQHTMDVRDHRDDYRQYKYWLDLEIPLHQAGILAFGRTGRGMSRLIGARAYRQYMLRVLREDTALLYPPGPWERDDLA